MKVSVGDLSLNVLDTGSGEPALVFLHYRGGSARTWQSTIELLKGSFRCISYDQRGWGASDAPTNVYGLNDLVHDASSLINSLNLRRYILVGHSMGGKAVQLLASRRPAGLAALVLVAPASPSPQHIPEDARQTQMHAYDNEQTALGAVDFLTALRPDATTTKQLIEDNLAGSPDAKRAWPSSLAYEDISSVVPNINVPTLILVGDHDRQDPEEQQRREVLPLIPKAKLEVISDCGHLIPVDQPLILAKAILSFVGNIS